MPLINTFGTVVTVACLATSFSLCAEAAPLAAGFMHQPVISAVPSLLQIDQKSGHLRHSQRRAHYLGYRGYPKYRPGYRWYNGWWYPPSAFQFGFNIVPPPREIVRPPLDLTPGTRHSFAPPPLTATELGSAHLHWCDQKYRSYRPADNSFQPYKGPRRPCVSPFGP